MQFCLPRGSLSLQSLSWSWLHLCVSVVAAEQEVGGGNAVCKLCCFLTEDCCLLVWQALARCKTADACIPAELPSLIFPLAYGWAWELAVPLSCHHSPKYQSGVIFFSGIYPPLPTMNSTYVIPPPPYSGPSPAGPSAPPASTPWVDSGMPGKQV